MELACDSSVNRVNFEMKLAGLSSADRNTRYFMGVLNAASDVGVCGPQAPFQAHPKGRSAQTNGIIQEVNVPPWFHLGETFAVEASLNCTIRRMRGDPQNPQVALNGLLYLISGLVIRVQHGPSSQMGSN